MDLINKAKDWTQVDEQLTHEVPGHLTRETRKIPSNGILTLKVNQYKHRVFLLSLGLFLFFFFFFLVGSRRCRFLWISLAWVSYLSNNILHILSLKIGHQWWQDYRKSRARAASVLSSPSSKGRHINWAHFSPRDNFSAACYEAVWWLYPGSWSMAFHFCAILGRKSQRGVDPEDSWSTGREFSSSSQ